MTKVMSEGDNYEEIVLKNLQKYTRYLVVVQAFNQVGEGPFSEASAAQTLEDGKYPSGYSSEERGALFTLLSSFLSSAKFTADECPVYSSKFAVPSGHLAATTHANV